MGSVNHKPSGQDLWASAHDCGQFATPGLISAFQPTAAFIADITGGREGAHNCRKQVQQKFAYSITLSARAITEAGTVIPSVLAVLRLMLRWKRVGCSNGRSAGLDPFKMRSIR